MSSMTDLDCASILGVNVHAQRFDDAIETLIAWARQDRQQDQRRYVCTSTVFNVMSCTEDKTVMGAVNEADMVTADGMPLVWVQRALGFRQAERVYGPDVLLAMCQRSVGQGIRHYFWGGAPGIADKLAAQLTAKFPGLEIAGAYSPPFGPVGTVPDPAVIEHLNSANADVIWVGIGSPKQDLWVSLYRPYLTASLLIAVGAAFDFLSGTKPQAPRWMQRSGLEWLFRLAREPRRLGWRYLLYNPWFIWRISRQLILQHRRAS